MAGVHGVALKHVVNFQCYVGFPGPHKKFSRDMAKQATFDTISVGWVNLADGFDGVLVGSNEAFELGCHRR